jgi:LuxR family maltose regulon positive regulatory protein
MYPMAGYRLFCFGNPGLELDGLPVKLEMRKSLALLVYLRVAAQALSRESLAALLWPEYDQQHAQANLRRTLASLNKSLRIDLLEADREKIGLKDPSQIWLDVEEFQEKLASWKTHPHPQTETCPACQSALESAVRLYRGDFLEGFNLNDCPDFDDWQFLQRESLCQELGLALQKLVPSYESQSQWKPAIDHARRWVSLDRLNEPASRTLIGLYARSGQRSAALRQYEELTRLLNEQLGQAPEQETRRLYEQIRKRDETNRVIESPDRTSSFPLLKTKLYIPAPPAGRVRRPALMERLAEVERKALTIISAPAGFGKTTLLAEWIAQTPLPVAWLSLDNGDNDPYRFLAYIIAALESVHEDVGLEAQQLMQSPQTVPAHIILASLINNLGKVTEPYVLAMDDYQFITETAVHEVLTYLLDHLPVNLHLLIATRADPPLHLGRLRAHSQMLELRIQDLRFSFEETTEFLNRVMRLGLSMEDIEALEARTEGWIVGLKMAALSLEGRADSSDFIRAFSGSHRYVLDYLLEEVLKRQPAHIQTFLLETSILEKLNSSLCDALIENGELRTANSQPLSSSQAILEYLEKSNLFLIPQDENKQWYRYHHLFADLLRSRLQQFSTERAVALQLQACRWYETEGLILDAIGHAMNAKDFQHAADLVEKMAYYSISGTDYATIQNWIDRIPENLVSSHPWVCIAQVYISIARGKLDKAEGWLVKAEAIARRLQEEEDTHQVEEIQNNLTILRAYTAFFAGDLASAINLGRSLLEKQQSMRTSLRGQLYQALGEFYLTVGEFEKSTPFLREAMVLGKQTPNLFLFTISTFRLGGLLKSQGKLLEAEKVYQENLKHLHEAGLRDSSLMGKSEIGLGDIIRERGDLITAEKILLQGLRHSQLQEQPYDLVFAYLYLSQLEHEKGNVQRALELLEQADKLFQIYSIPPTVRLMWEYYCVRLWMAKEEWEQIEKWIEKRHLEIDVPVIYLNELILTALSRVHIARGELSEALSLLGLLAQEVETAGRYGRLIEIWNLSALALYKKGNTDEALDNLRKSLTLAEPEGYARIFLDEGEPMIELLKRLRGSNLSPPLKEYANRLLRLAFPPE